MKLIDLHNHTKFSYDGSNTPEEIIENAIANGIDVIGISDHQFSVREEIPLYIDKIHLMKEKYKDKIDVKCGIEIGTRPAPDDLLMSYANRLDYCLFECLDDTRAMDFYEFLEWQRLFKIPKGFAHTDIFALSERYGIDMIKIIKENDFFWELNTSGHYNYYYDFITNPKKQEIISKSNIKMSVGSDTHWIHDFKISKVKSAHELISKLGNPIIFS